MGVQRFHRAFSLVELMTVVAIIAVLASIAIPSVYTTDLNAKRAEIATNVRGIVVAEVAYQTAMDASVALPQFPALTAYHPVALASLGKGTHAWAAGANLPYFDTLGFKPDGDVRGTYQIADWLVPAGSLYFSGFSNLDVAGAAYAYQWRILGNVSAEYYESPPTVY